MADNSLNFLSENLIAITHITKPSNKCTKCAHQRTISENRSDKQTKIPTAVYHVTTYIIKI